MDASEWDGSDRFDVGCSGGTNKCAVEDGPQLTTGDNARNMARGRTIFSPCPVGLDGRQRLVAWEGAEKSRVWGRGCYMNDCGTLGKKG